ncbi:MAG: efflux RND transporter periplasmic adaptor subunit [Phycisphaerae bacterium]|nr:efflux RND transporter periplasmic adaptor subunit [Phycisphaerae bacterium]
MTTTTENNERSTTEAAAVRVRSGRRGRWIAAGLVLAGLVLVGLVASIPTAKESVPPVEPVPVNVTVRPVSPVAELADTFVLPAVVQPNAVVKVAAEVSGRIEGYGVRASEASGPRGVLPAGSEIAEGQPVSAGDPLVILNRELLEAQRERVAAQHAYDQQEFERIRGLHEQNVASETELNEMRTRRDVSRAQLDEAQRMLARTTITAPIGGILNDWVMEPGEYAAPGEVVAEIVDIDTVKVQADVSERDADFLRVGQTAEVLRRGEEAAPLTGTITYINAVADEATRTTRIEVTVPNRIEAEAGSGEGGYRLRSGQIVNVRLTRRVLQDVIMVPLASVIPLEEGKEVYVVREGKVERRPVELGIIRGLNIQAVSGLEPGELLIVAGQRLASPGQPVHIVPADPSTQSALQTVKAAGDAP